MSLIKNKTTSAAKHTVFAEEYSALLTFPSAFHLLFPLPRCQMRIASLCMSFVHLSVLFLARWPLVPSVYEC